MKKRSISAFFIVLILTIAIYYGSYLFGILIGLCAILGFREFVNIKKKGNKNKLSCIELISLITLLLLVFNNTFWSLLNSNILDLAVLIYSFIL